MHLKRLEVVGFKSFATRVAADFHSGIAVVVGPNGSGKSNIADAVRWVLGEQSAKAVRARKPDEVIFAGSTQKQPLGMAEVSLILDNTDGQIPLAFGEVRVTRRLYRSGDSEYLLNNSKVRLRDVTTRLLHARLGPDSYCVIGQGSVDELILQRPEERRVAFESAADIRRHQIQLNDTRGKIHATEANLTRVQDILAELAPHVRRLKGQADRAARTRSARVELQMLSIHSYQHQLWQARLERAAAEAALQSTTSELEAAQREAAAAHGLLAASQRQLQALDAEMRELRPRLEGDRQALHTAERGLAVAAERSGSLAEERRRVEADRAQAEARLAALREEEAAHAAAAAEGPEDAAVVRGQKELADFREAQQRLAAQALEVQVRLQAARRTRDSAEQRLSEADRELGRSEQRARSAEAAAAVEAARRQDREARLADQRARLAVLTEESVSAASRLQEARTALAASERVREEASAIARAAQGMLQSSAQQADRLQGQLDALGAGETRGVSGLSDAWRGALEGLPVVGVAGEVAARVRPIDRLLRGYLMRTVVVSDDAGAREAHRRLLALLSAESPAWAVLSLDGLLLTPDGARPVEAQDGAVSALADWRATVERLDAERHAAMRRRVQMEARVTDATAALARAEEAVSQGRAEVQRAEGMLQQARRAEAAARGELGTLETEARRADASARAAMADQGEHARRVERLRQVQEGARSARVEAIAAMQSLEEQLTELKELTAEQAARGTALEAEQNRRATERRSREALLGRIRSDLQAAVTTLDGMRLRLEEIQSQQAAVDARREDCDREAARAREMLAHVQQALGQSEARRSALMAEGSSAERRAEACRTAGRLVQGRREAALVRAQRARDERERLEREVSDSIATEDDDAAATWVQQLGFLLANHDAAPALVPESGFDLEGARRRIAQLQRELRSSGGVSESVVEEHRELSERHDFLQRQAADLVGAMAELREAERVLEEHMRARFSAVFEAVNGAFHECFVTLFGGGEARLVLTDPDDLLGTGIDIVARPPGKKLQALLSMSGGERALTIVALLFGLLKVNPTPFCVLDEVDAALDEANVQRFAALLVEFSHRIQFVVVTHNRATMEVADAMYGVTMDAAGVSRVMSLQPKAARAAPSGVGA